MHKTSLLGLALCLLLSAGCNDLQPDSAVIEPGLPQPTFVDSTARFSGSVQLGTGVYVGPFASLQANGGQSIVIGSDSNVQDNVAIVGTTSVGSRVILAHGCAVQGPAVLGMPGGQPCFVGFNALVDGATIEPDAMVGIRARVGPGVVLHSGKRVLPGKNVTTQAEADDGALGKVVNVTDGDRSFMAGVLTVNRDLAEGYSHQSDELSGIARDPQTPLHPVRLAPTLNGVETIDPTFRNRIIGDVRMEDDLAELNAKMGTMDSLRADEGGPFLLGTLGALDDEVTFHALEHSGIECGDGLVVGAHAVLHGGEDVANPNPERLVVGDNVNVGARAVLFRSSIGSNCSIGEGAVVDGCQLPDSTMVPANTILVGNQNQGLVEW